MASDVVESLVASAAGGRDVDWIIQELDTAGRKLPVEAIVEARKRREEVVPRLMEVLRETAREARETGESPEGLAPFLALFLLTEFRAKEALPAILHALSLPGQLSNDLFKDAITETLPRTFATLAGDQVEFLDSVMANREVNVFARSSAAESFRYLVRDGRMERGEAVKRLEKHLRNGIEHQEYEFNTLLICALESLYPVEAFETIAEAFERDVVEAFMICQQDIDDAIERGEDDVRRDLQRLEPTGIEDTIEELSEWSCFQEPKEPYRPNRDTERHELPAALLPAAPDPAPVAEPVVNDAPRVGRNELCPCGSGKKYKKCCGSR